MTEGNLSPIEKLKLAIITVDKTPDSYVKKMFLDFDVTSQDAILEICGCLRKHRPELVRQLEKELRTGLP